MAKSTQHQDPQEFVHIIDNAGSISYVNDAWLDFAAENGWPVSAEEMIGSRLMSSIMDPETRHIYGLLINRVRELGQPTRFNYRCDSPDLRRLMEMRISHDQASDQVVFSSRIISSEKRQPIVLIDPSYKNRSDEILRMCGWCKSVWDKHGWVELEKAVQLLGFMTDQVLPRISHGICDDCSKNMTRLMDNP